MHFFKAILFFSAVAHCRNLQVYVGLNNTITFKPSTLRAIPGDTVEFIFAGLVSRSAHPHESFIGLILL
jgi:plastocyanin